MTNLPTSLCYLNGEYLPINEAKISVLDRGFIFGDGVYEVVPVYQGRFFRWEDHMARLQRSLDAMRMVNPHTPDEWRVIAKRLMEAFAQEEQAELNKLDLLVYWQITRGVAPREHAMLQGLTPTVFMTVSHLPKHSAKQRAQGVWCVTAEDFRWKRGHIKCTSLAAAVFARQISVDAGAVETVMFRDGFLSEAASSNVWIVKDGVVLGSPTETHLVLQGVRYHVLADLCRITNTPYELRPVSREEVFNADEVLLTSASKEVLPITKLDDQMVGSGKPGPIYERLYQGYQQLKAQA